MSRSAVAWAAFEGFRNPVIVLIGIYVFMPYYVATVAPDPVRGQALLAAAGQAAGWIVALTAPLIGVVVDRTGRRKPGQALMCVALALLAAAFWFVTPGGPVTPPMFFALAAGYVVLFTWIELFHNTLLVGAAKGQVARTSGLGLALGNAVSVLALVAVLWMFALPGTVDWTWVPAAPVGGLDTAAHEQARIVGPIAGALLLAGLAVVLLFVPDAPPTGTKLGTAVRAGWADLKALIGELRREPNAFRFLVARMLYADGKNLIVGFAGVLAVGLMKWETLELLAFGILMSVAAVGGGLLAGRLDEWLGAKRAVMWEVGLAFIGWCLVLLGGEDRILGVGVAPSRWWGGPLFATTADLAYLATSALVAVFVTAAYASSRTLLVQLVPAEKIGSFFGLYVLSGTATGWLGPLMLALLTVWTGSQAGGMVAILILLAAGWVGMLTVAAPVAAPRAASPQA